MKRLNNLGRGLKELALPVILVGVTALGSLEIMDFGQSCKREIKMYESIERLPEDVRDYAFASTPEEILPYDLNRNGKLDFEEALELAKNYDFERDY